MSRPPFRVSLLWGALGDGGLETVMLTLAKEFLDRGIETDIVLMEKKGERVDRVPSDAQVFDLEAHQVIAGPFALAKYLRQRSPSVLLSAGYTNRFAPLARTLAGVAVPIVIAEHNIVSMPTSGSNFPNIVLDQLMKWTYPLADQIIAVSEGVADDVSQSLNLRRENFEVIYNPVVGPETFKYAKQNVEHPWFSNNSIPVILGVGRLSEQKDFSTLIQAFANLRENRESRLVILGEGRRRTVLEKKAEQLEVRNQVWMPGFVSNPLKYMSDASVFVLSSKWGEGHGNVLVEAMACGTPVISTDCPGGPSEILEGGKHGQLVPVEDPHIMAQAIGDVLDGHVPPAESSALERFRRETVVKKYLDTLGGVALPYSAR
jgi:glycosyltransferase involved in cell wall biosynthesis